MKTFTSAGQLLYSESPDKLIVEVDHELSNFYFSTIPKYCKVKKPFYPAHISVVRNTTIPNKEFWRKHHSKVIEFVYENWVYNDELYYWLHVFSSDLEEIRRELGLPSSGDVSLSPDGRHKFHITIGNTK